MAPPANRLGTGAARPPTSMKEVYHGSPEMAIIYRMAIAYVIKENSLA